jgi:hypothetical protein
VFALLDQRVRLLANRLAQNSASPTDAQVLLKTVTRSNFIPWR